jgi:alpha-galactosidase/6-phospho-beta-glucosidase family protein
MKKKLKIVMVGGGSYNWGPRLLCDLVQTPELENSEVVLLDINLAAAKEVKAAIDRVCRDNSKKFLFTATRDEDKAFKDADFVFITISTGGLDMMQHDLEIPERYGIYQAVGDTSGPGGWSRLLRNVPVFTKMARKIEKLSPNAVVMNYTNPMSGLTGAIAAVTKLRSVGLCHGVMGTINYLSRMMGVEEKDLSVRYGGVNHFFWIVDFKVNGKDGYPMLRKKLGKSTLLKFDMVSKDPAGFSENNHRIFAEVFEHYGYLTYVVDSHSSEFFTSYLTDPKIIKDFKIKRKTVEGRRNGLVNARQFALDMASGKVKMLPRSREKVVDIMKAMATNTPFIDVVNLPNIGQIDNLPRGAVVETLGLVDSAGFAPIAIGPLPEILRGLTEVHCHVQKMTLEAALTGDRKLAVEALCLDPLCAKLAPSQIRKMGMELMKATGKYLPQFKN